MRPRFSSTFPTHSTAVSSEVTGERTDAGDEERPDSSCCPAGAQPPGDEIDGDEHGGHDGGEDDSEGD